MRVRTHANPFRCRHRLEKIDFSKEYPAIHQNLDLEIGFGQGLFLRHYAKNNPNRLIVGIEVRKPTAELLQERVAKEAIENAIAIYGNGLIALEDMFEDDTLDNIFVFHPDPWFKKKHHKRRVVNKAFLDLAKQKLKPNGLIHISTDVDELWEAMIEELESHNKFIKLENHNFWKTQYLTNWQQFSIKDSRNSHFSSFKLNPQT